MRRSGFLLLLLAACEVDVPLVHVADSGVVCRTNDDCHSADLYCSKSAHACSGFGFCERRRPSRCTGSASLAYAPVCGWDGLTYFNDCLSMAKGVAIDVIDECASVAQGRCMDHCAPPGVCTRLSCEPGPELCYVAPSSCPDLAARSCWAPQCIDLCASLPNRVPGPFALGCQ